MESLTRFGLDKARFTVLAMVIILVVGALSYLGLPKREDPEITIRTAVVTASFAGMAPERVENLIVVPVERRIREISEVEDIESVITTGQAIFYVDLHESLHGEDVASAWEDLRNKMTAVAAELPEGTSKPRVNTDYGDVAIATVAITGDGFTLAQIEDVADDLRTSLYTLGGRLPGFLVRHPGRTHLARGRHAQARDHRRPDAAGTRRPARPERHPPGG